MSIQHFLQLPLPLTPVKHCKYKRGSFVGQVLSLSHLRPPPPLCLCAFALHSSGAWHALSWHILSCLGPGSVGVIGRILRWSQDSRPLMFTPVTLLIRLHDVTKVKRFCRCSQGLKSVDFEFIERKSIMGESDLIRRVLKKLGGGAPGWLCR